jgi:hypothetical protein
MAMAIGGVGLTAEMERHWLISFFLDCGAVFFVLA